MGTYTKWKEVFLYNTFKYKVKEIVKLDFVICLYANSPKMKGSEQQNDVNVNIKQNDLVTIIWGKTDF